MMQRHFLSTLHPLSLVIFATATVVAFVLLHNSRCWTCCYSNLYTAWSNAHSEIGLEMTLQPLMTSYTKDYKGHSFMQTSFTEPPNTQAYIYIRVEVAVKKALVDSSWQSPPDISLKDCFKYSKFSGVDNFLYKLIIQLCVVFQHESLDIRRVV